MLIPYTGEALKTYEKIHTLKLYEHDHLYPFKDTYYYINSKGYLHIYLLSAVNFKGSKSFYISDMLLTKDNMLKEAGQHSRLYDTKQATIESLMEGINNE